MDERFYIGEDVPFRPRPGPARSLLPPPASATSPAGLEHRRRTLAWAATAVIRGAESIALVDADDGFTELARLEPGRVVSTLPWEGLAAAAAFDLAVCLRASAALAEQERLAGIARLAPRAILAEPASEDRADPHASRLYARLSRYYRRVRLFHLPDPSVPWLEPMECPLAAASIIAECSEPVTPSDVAGGS